MELTAEDYHRLRPLYPQSKFAVKGDPSYIAFQQQKRAMLLHVARERGFGEIKPLWNAILQCQRAGFTLEEIAIVLETDMDTITQEWEIIRQNAR